MVSVSAIPDHKKAAFAEHAKWRVMFLKALGPCRFAFGEPDGTDSCTGGGVAYARLVVMSITYLNPGEYVILSCHRFCMCIH